MLIPDPVLSICRTLHDAGHEAWLVGGAVRDSILHRPAHDWDIATDAHPKTVAETFDRVVLTGEKHGTVSVILDGTPYEVTTYRGDGDYSDGRRPDSVRFLNTIEEDLARRDFTMNAVAYDPLANEWRDPFWGFADTKNGLIRCVGDPVKRFAEDGLRVLRACRFAATLDFDLVPDTEVAIRSSLYAFSRVSVERVRDEWTKALAARHPSVAFRLMQKTGILNVHAPEFASLVGCAQNQYHAFDVWNHTMAVLDACPVGDPGLRLAALFHDAGKPKTIGVHEKTGARTFHNHEEVGAEIADTVLDRFKSPTAERQRVCHLVRHHLIPYELGWAAAAVRRWVRRVGLDHVPSLLTLARADIVGKGPAAVPMRTEAIDDLERRIATMQITETMPVSTKVLAIDGRDVMAELGIGPGPQVGIVLRALLEIVTDDPEANTRERLLVAAHQIPA